MHPLGGMWPCNFDFISDGVVWFGGWSRLCLIMWLIWFLLVLSLSSCFGGLHHFCLWRFATCVGLGRCGGDI